MILLAKRKPEFSSLRTAVISKVETLQNKVQEAVREEDIDKGDQLSDIFVELGCSHID